MEQIKMIVVLGELGGRDEYSLVEALQQGRVHKPVVAWVSGTCARLFKSEVQFGHAVRSFLPFALYCWSTIGNHVC
jgi:succinyl-CoA synthetase alpha subunit